MSDKTSIDSNGPSTTRRTAIKTVAGIVGIGTGIVPLAQQTAAKSNTVRIMNSHSGKALTATHQGNGTNVHQWDYGSNGEGQLWHVTDVSSGLLKFENVASGKALQLAGMSANNGANVIQGKYTGKQNQLWKDGENATLVNGLGGFVLEVGGWGTDNGDNVQVWNSHGGDNQKWSFRAP